MLERRVSGDVEDETRRTDGARKRFDERPVAVV